MFYIDNEETKELHSIDEISQNKKDAEQVLDMLIHATVPYQYGASEESVLDNMKFIRFYLFKDTEENILLCPDLIVVEIDNTYEDENGVLVYNTIKRIVSYREFNIALDEKGYKLDIQKIEELVPIAKGNVVDVNISRKNISRKLVRM